MIAATVVATGVAVVFYGKIERKITKQLLSFFVPMKVRLVKESA